MKKILLLFVITGFVTTGLQAQEPVFVNGDKVLNVALGLGNSLYWGTNYRTQVPPISASLEFGVADEIIDKGSIGVGPYLGFSSTKYEYLNAGWKYSNIILGGKGNFHYPLVDKLDTYAGLLIGFNIATSREFGSPSGTDSYARGGLVWAGFIGGRYYFSDNLAALAELGYGIAYLNIGIALKL